MLSLMAGVCAATLLVNESKEKWTPSDMATQTQARIRCKQIDPNYPCLVKFVKKEPQVFWAVCGRARSSGS